MTERLRELITYGDYTEARKLADYLYVQGEQSETFWILNASLYRIEGNKQAEYACITRGLKQNAHNYELYYMLGEYYQENNINQAFLCMEQAEYYCNQAEDLEFIQSARRNLQEKEECKVHPVSIVILSYNIKDIMIECIQSIRDTCPVQSYELVVVDNASTDGIVDWLREQTDIILRCNTENKGFAGGCNQGIEMAAENNDIMLLNNDTVVPPNAIFWLRMALYERETVGAAGPLTNYAGNDQQIMGVCETKEEYLKLAEEICVPTPYAYENKVWLVGFAMMIKREAINKAGLLDTRYTWGNYEDNDYGMSLTKAGYELLLCYNSFIYHYGSMNMAKDKQKYLAYIKENGQKLKEKWGLDSGRYNGIDEQMLLELQENVRPSMRILQIGCGWGATLARIKHLYPDAKVYGVEEDETVASFGKYLAEISVGNAEELEFLYPLNYFDYIFVDETYPIHNLKGFQHKLKKYLKEGGKIKGIETIIEEETCLTSQEQYEEIIVKHEEKIVEYIQKINDYLKDKTASSISQFLNIMQEKEILKYGILFNEDLAYAYIFSNITEKELQHVGTANYLLNGNSIDELRIVLKKIEFRLWKMEFEQTRQSEMQLYEMMEQFYITPEAMSCIVAVAAMNKTEAYLILSCIYLENENQEAALSLLKCALEWYPSNEEIRQMLSKLCEKAGKPELVEK